MSDNYSDLIGIGLTAEQIETEIKRREEPLKPKFDPYRVQFVINPYRKVRIRQKQIKCSRYAKELFKIGAGWSR